MKPSPGPTVPLPRRAVAAGPGAVRAAPGGHCWAGDPFEEALRTGRGPLWLCFPDGTRTPFDVERWCAPAGGADEGLLRRCERDGRPVLDVGCGPGRLVAELLRRGVPALGIDVTAAAVARTRRTGGVALLRSVFAPLPREGHWGTVLLADGNLGIGGDPAALLRRCAQLLLPDGELLVEVEPGTAAEGPVRVRVEDGLGRRGPSFPWSRTGTDATAELARRSGLVETGRWTDHGRAFLALRPGPRSAD